MIIYRITTDEQAYDLSGESSHRVGARWHSRGSHMLYGSTSRSLASLEYLAHIPSRKSGKRRVLVTLELPDVEYPKVSLVDLPGDWELSPFSESTQRIGDEFLSTGDHLAMMVPSTSIPEEYNVIINPEHSDSAQIKVLAVEPFRLRSM